MVRISYFTAVSNSMNGFKTAAEKIITEEYRISIEVVDNVDIENPEIRKKFIKAALASDILIIRLMGGLSSFSCWDEIQGKMSGDIFIVPSGSRSVKAADKHNTIRGLEADNLSLYPVYGGVDNYYNLLLSLINKYTIEGDRLFTVEPAKPLPGEGIYHPDFESNPEKHRYFREKIKGDNPVAGIWFHRGNWVNLNTSVIDDVIHSCENKGFDVIPVFISMDRGIEGSMTPEEAADYFFSDDEGKCIIDVHINLMMFSLSSGTAVQSDNRWFFTRNKIPVFQGILSNESEKVWTDSIQGLNPVTITLGMALPELDGNITTVPVGFKDRSERDPVTGTRFIRHRGNPERINHFTSLVRNWAELKRIPNNQKRVAILFHNHPPRNDTIGGAYLLDSPKSVCTLAEAMKRAGYFIDGFPDSGNELMKIIKAGLTNDSSWLSDAEIEKRAAAVYPIGDFKSSFETVSKKVKEQMINSETFPGKDFYIPGREFGNLFIGIQPGRQELHDPDAPVDYQYLAYYWWLREIWRADALIHVGRHGSVEWLNGKGAGLSGDCYTDLALGEIPHLYIYVVNAPGEGVQAKRRGNACLVDHNIPVMDRAGLYGEMAAIETILDEYDDSKINDPARTGQILVSLKEKILTSDFLGEIDLDSPACTEKIHNLLDEAKNTQVRDGLHILGKQPEGEDLIRFLIALTSFGTEETPSLQDCLKKELNLRDKDMIYAKHRELLTNYFHCDFDPAKASDLCVQAMNSPSAGLISTLERIGKELVPALRGAHREIDSLLDALSGKAVPTGPSGAPTRGSIDALPTGKNFFTLDPRLIPSPSAWETGRRMAESLLTRYKSEEGKLPESIAIVLWGGSSMRTRGDDIAEIFYLMGVKPRWKKGNGWVKDLEVLPLEELGRPRIDVTCKISGLFRDALPNVITLIDKAVRKVAFLDEPLEMNFIKAHVIESIKKNRMKGLSPEAAGEESLFRVFGVKPGAYGSGVNQLVNSGKWENQSELGERYIEWGGWAYAPGKMGVDRRDLFRDQLSNVDVAIKNQDHRESDFMDSDDWFDYHGGMIAAIKGLTGKSPASFMGDSSRSGEITTRSPAEEARLVFRTRVLNPKWIESMKAHGYKGALDISRSLDNAFGWDAVADVVDDWMYDRFAEKYALDHDTSEWIEEVNPDALRNLVERLFEAKERGMWNPSPEVLEKLKNVYMNNEKKLEIIYDH